MVPFPKTIVFYLSWIFTIAAIGTQVYVIRTAFFKDDTIRSKFYGFPIAKIGAVYLLAQFILGLIFMGLCFITSVPPWIPLILYVILLGGAFIGFISADAVRDEITRQDTKLKKDVSCMRTLQSKATMILGQAKSEPVRKAAENFSEKLRFSDPVSSEVIRDIEIELTNCADEIEKAVLDADNVNAVALFERAETILLERNRLCKLSKSENN